MYIRQLILPLLLLLGAGNTLADSRFLHPDQAFIPSGTLSDSQHIALQWKIAEGYYLYQSKFRFSTETAGITLGNPQLPPAETKADPVFGDVQIYRNSVRISLPLERTANAPDMLTLKARIQGCAENGICYPPHTQTLLVALDKMADAPQPVDPAAAEQMQIMVQTAGSPSDETTGPGNLDALQELGALQETLGLGDDDGILPVEQAFRFQATAQDANHLKLHWDIAEGTYLYQEKLKIAVSGEGIEVGSFELPAPKIKHDGVRPDGNIGNVAVYLDSIDLLLPLQRAADSGKQVELKVSYQGCAERGICYPPVRQALTLALPADGEATIPADKPKTTLSQNASDTTPVAEQDRIAGLLKQGNTLLIVAAFFGIGLLLAFTPCVFPMIPILSGIIAGHGSEITTRKAFWLSLVYVLAMSVTYTVAGVLAGLFGANLQAAFQNPWILSLFAVIFVALALSMFGFFELQLPSSWQSRLSETSNRQQGGTLTGAAVMGLLSALIVGPCVAPPLAGALIYIGQTGDGLLGGLALFAMSLGMGAPLIAIGTGAGKLLPRAGAWMDTVKGAFGVMMLGVAIYLLERIIPVTAAMLLWGTLLVTSAVYMGALQQLPVEASGWKKLSKGLGMVLLIYGTLFFIGVAAGARDSLQPLRGLGGESVAQQAEAEFKPIKSVSDLQRELATAKRTGQAVMLDFYADWCVYCKQMERDTFPAPEVQRILRNMVLLRADVTENDEVDKALMTHIGIPAPPAMIFWNSSGEELRHLRLLGFKDAAAFAAHIGGIGN